MDELAIASGLLTVVLALMMAMVFGPPRHPIKLQALTVYLILPLLLVTMLCTTINGGIALGHMIGWVPR